MRKLSFLFLGLAFAALLNSCQTVQGMGRDISGAGAGLEKAAR